MKNPDNVALNELMKQVQTNKVTNNVGSSTNIVSLPSHASDDCIGFSDIPIMKVSSDLKATKPTGSAFISAKISIGRSSKQINANVCIDTGADITLHSC
jgi:hypothetical protein